VFEREIGLRNYVESGIPIDSTVSYDLLGNIFQPGTPLHDGAVIISEGRLAAAACFLPLAVSPKLDRDLGTRHRAAIGLTEETDAIAVVISEERGEISIARHGQISRRLSVEELRDRLQTLILQRRRNTDQNAGGDGVDA
jgi:diadenylate cyclase